jgi:capsular polysaccharide biosynthesis protein
MTAAICAVLKNEECILEWIAFHKAIGFDAFIIIDDHSTNGMTGLIEMAQASQEVDIRLSTWEEIGKGQQGIAYAKVCQKYKEEFEWIAFIDGDEFIVPAHIGKISELLDLCKDFSAIALQWLIFGSSNHVEKPQGLVIDNYTGRAVPEFGPNRHVKSIVRPNKVIRGLNPHFFEVDGGYCHVDGNAVEWTSPGLLKTLSKSLEWRVHHYFTRSKAHWLERMQRGQLGAFTRTLEDFISYDRNEITDLSAKQFSDTVKSIVIQFYCAGLPLRDTSSKPLEVKVSDVLKIVECSDLPQRIGITDLKVNGNGSWKTHSAEPRILLQPTILNPSKLNLIPTLPNYFEDQCVDAPFPSSTIGHDIYLTKLQSGICLSGGLILADGQHLLGESFRHGNNWTRFSRGGIKRVGERVALTRQTPTPKKLSGRCLFLDGEHFPHYGHWVLEILSRLWVYEYLDLRDYTIIIGKNAPAYVFDFLLPFGITQGQTVVNDGAFLCEELWIPSQAGLVRQSISGAGKDVYSKISRYYDRGYQRADRIYVSRQNQAARKLKNELAVEGLFRKYGFHVVYPELLSIADQVSLFSHAKIIAGCSGTNLFNCLFSHNSQLRIVLTSDGYILHTDQIINSFSGGDLTYVFGLSDDNRNPHADWTVDLHALEALLNANLSAT